MALLRVAVGVALLLSGVGVLPPAADSAEVLGSGPGGEGVVAVPDFLDAEPFRSLALELEPGAMESLRRAPRSYVPARVRIDHGAPVRVDVRLRGSTGSFRPVDDKPAWTLDFARVSGGLGVGGVSRMQLGNGVEDPGLWNEWLGSGAFRRAGIPAPRVVHARVSLNGRPLGLHVLKEGFSREFLARSFSDRGTGELYDNDHGPDVEFPIHRCLEAGGTGGHGRGWVGLESVRAAVRVSDPEARWRRLSEEVDLSRLVDFMVTEVAIGHRDGYGLARNNWRIYRCRDDGRVVLLPDGMDQLLGNPSLSWNPVFSGTLARSVIETPAGCAAYAGRWRELLPVVLDPVVIGRELDRRLAALRPLLGGGEYRVLARGAEALKVRVTERRRFLDRQLADTEQGPGGGPVRLAFEGDWAPIREWHGRDDPGGARLSRGITRDGVAVLTIEGAEASAAAWSARFRVPEPGSYRVEARMRAEGVVPREGSRQPGGGLRVAGASRPGMGCVGDTPWVGTSVPLEVLEPDQAIELRLELAARAGCLRADLDSLRVVRLAAVNAAPGREPEPPSRSGGI